MMIIYVFMFQRSLFQIHWLHLEKSYMMTGTSTVIADFLLFVNITILRHAVFVFTVKIILQLCGFSSHMFLLLPYIHFLCHCSTLFTLWDNNCYHFIHSISVNILFNFFYMHQHD